MKISFRSTKLRKIFDSEKNLKREYGTRMASAIMTQVDVLRISACLAEVPTKKPTRCHQLTGDRDEQFAIDLVQPYRLVFEVEHDPIPRDEFGGIDRKRVTAIIIIAVTDYH